MKLTLCLTLVNIALGLGAQNDSRALTSGEFDLQLVQVLCRHGERTPLKEEIYKNDPYASVYSRIGYGELTQMGKARMHKFGQNLRKLYGNLLAENGTDKVYAYHSGLSRTEESLRMVLSGIFPSKYSLFTSPDKYGLPLTLHNDSMELNFLMTGMKGKCSPEYWRIVRGNLDLLMQSRNEDLKSLDIDVVANLTGAKASPIGMTLLHYNLIAVKLMGFPLPEWCSKVNCATIENFVKLFAKSLTPNEWTKRITAGVLLQQFLKNMEKSHSDEKKLHLYVAHDIQLMVLAQTLNFTDVPELPGYGSSVTIEKLRRKIDGRIYVRMTMDTGEQPRRVIPLKLQGCDFNCPIEKFEVLIRPFFPFNEDWECLKASGMSYY